MSNLQDLKKKQEFRLSLTSLRDKAISRIETESQKSLLLPVSATVDSSSDKQIRNSQKDLSNIIQSSGPLIESSKTESAAAAPTSTLVQNSSQYPESTAPPISTAIETAPVSSRVQAANGDTDAKPQGEKTDVKALTGGNDDNDDDEVYDDNLESESPTELSKSGHLLPRLTASRPKPSGNRRVPTKNTAREMSKMPSTPVNTVVTALPPTTATVKAKEEQPQKHVGVKLPGMSNSELSGATTLRKVTSSSNSATSPPSANSVVRAAQNQQSSHEVDSIRNRLRSVQGQAKEEIKKENTVRSSYGDLKNSSISGSGKSMEALQVEENLQSARGSLKSVQKLNSTRDIAASSTSSQAASSDQQQQQQVPEFMLLRQKLKSVQQQKGSRDDLEVKNSSSSDLRDSRSDLRNNRFSMFQPATQPIDYSKPVSKDNFNRFAQSTPSSQKSWSTPSSTSISPTNKNSISSTAATASNNNNNSKQVLATPLKNTKNDPFLNISGGSIRPTIPLMWVIKGKRKLFAQRVLVRFTTLNLTDCFILDIPATPTKSNDPEKQNNRLIFVTSGSNSSKVRRIKAIEIANLIKDFDYSGKADIVLVELGNIKSRVVNDEEMKFWQQLFAGENITRSTVSEKADQIAKAGKDDSDFDAQMDGKEVVLTKFDQNADKTVYNGAKELKKQLLTTLDSIVLEYPLEIYVWAGKLSTEKTRTAALKFAEQLQNNRNDSYLFMEGDKFERVTFKLKFEDWQAGKELSVYNVLEVKQAGNIKPKDKEWKVYDRGSDTKKVDEIDIVRMYDKNSAPENAIAKNSETVDMDPNELIRKDWGFKSLRCWTVFQMSGSSDKNSKVSISADSLSSMELKFSQEKPLVLYSQECYIFLYEYMEKPPKMTDPVLVERMKITKEELESGMKEHAIMYIWSGAESSVADQGVTAHVALEIEKHVKTSIGQAPKAKQVRVFEGKEPTHFLTMLRGGRIHHDEPKKVQSLLQIHSNPPSPAVVYYRGSRQTVTDKTDLSLFHVLGSVGDNVRVTQMSTASSEYLCSGAVYVLYDNKQRKATIWNGKGSFSCEREAASTFVSKILNLSHAQNVEEGSESTDFWNLLGGKASERSDEEFWTRRPKLPVDWLSTNVSLGSSTQADVKSVPYDVRLWKINHFLNGNPTAAEICPFTQQDLENDSVYILDAYFKVYVWIGAFTARNHDLTEGEIDESSVLKKFAFEKQTAKSAATEFKDIKLALDTVVKYVDFINERESGRVCRKDCLVLQGGYESPLFRAQFPNWKHTHRVNEEKWPSNIGIVEALEYFDSKKYSPDQLRTIANTRTKLPFGLELEHLEKYLKAEDFQPLFGMDSEKFSSLPHWKQVEMKRKVGLF